MARVILRLYVEPGGAELFVNLRRKDGGYDRVTAIVDTGAAISLFPKDLLPELDYRLTEGGDVEIDQAGIVGQPFTAQEVIVWITLEDESGIKTRLLEIRAWFAETKQPLLGFAGVLDRAKLFIDMEDTRTGWIEMRDT
jgi:hypothetical protein